MSAFRIILLAFFLIITTYTTIVVVDYGFTLFLIFINDILSLTWSGQFNLDFSLYLALSGIWIAWRHQFSAGGIFMGIVASILGMAVFAPYLLVSLSKAKGDMRVLLTGSKE